MITIRSGFIVIGAILLFYMIDLWKISKPAAFYFDSLTIITAPAHHGQGKDGVQHGPSAILGPSQDFLLHVKGLKYAYNSEIIWKNFNVMEGPKDWIHSSNNQTIAERSHDVFFLEQVSSFNQKLHDMTRQASSQHKFVLTLGGDHSIAIGTIAGMRRTYPDLAVLWIDAHADINFPEESKSGNLHGCPVAFLMGLGGTTSMASFHWLASAASQSNGYLHPTKLAYIGLRDIELSEKKILRSYNIKAYTMIDVVQKGISVIMDDIFEYFGNVPIHVSFDIDSVDPLFAPSTGTPVHAGLLERDVRLLADILCRASKMVSLDVVEVNPSLGSLKDSEKTVQIARRLTASFLQDFYN